MKKISRRDFLKVTGLMGAAAALTACGGSASSAAASTASSAAAARPLPLQRWALTLSHRGPRCPESGRQERSSGFSFQDTLTGEYKGLEDSLAEMIAEHLGVDVEFTTVTAATRGELLDSGDIDAVLATFTITEERKKTWDFSTPYYTDYVSVLVEDSTGIKGLADLKDKVVGVSSGSTSARALVKAMIDEGVLDGANFDADTFNADTWKDGVSFRQYDDYPAISTALSAGEVQASASISPSSPSTRPRAAATLTLSSARRSMASPPRRAATSPPCATTSSRAGWQMAPSSSSSKTTVWIKPDFSEPRECRERGVCHVWLVFVRVLVHRLDAS